MSAAHFFGLVLLLVLVIAGFIFGVNVVVWNIRDIWDNGANFWNVFWIMLVGVLIFGGAGRSK